MFKYSLRLVITLLAMFTTQAAFADAEKKMQICIGCHGLESSTSPEYPNLAGQNARYIFNQVQNFKNGSRDDFTMTMMVEAISDEDIQKISEAYAKITPAKNKADAKLAAKGKVIFEEVCIACHGASGMGDENIARLASQKSVYIVKQLKAFKSGARKNDTMPDVAAALSVDDMKAVAEFISGL
ncbi:c-type cytochrome [Mariprofundus sp. KV]|uniref:c-type cytochrome n=1 Tax=Mariprofundus sp. KV TaxID=2608715 RepID=UPI0015A4C20B|nr:c-type cytochrome [Mariprofundus sp. KV]NWF36878.1 cytochrome c4 [Mariprofundus sp. KV]